MVLVGLTGGIASGKSTVSQQLTSLGAKIIDADAIARLIVLPGQPAWRAIIKLFGKAILLPDQTLDRLKLGEIIFSDAKARLDLEQLLHPLIEQELKRQIACCLAAQNRVVFLDIPLLYEVGWDKLTTINWVIYVTPPVQLQRLMARNNFSRAQATQRIASQMPLAEKIKLATVVIDNNGDLVYTKRQVHEQWNALSKNGNE